MSEAAADDFLAANALELWQILRRFPAVLVRALRAGPPPGGWSAGPELVTQALDVAVEETLCGRAPAAATLALDLPLVKGARVSDSEPRLAAWLADPGARSILLLADGALCDEDLGAMPATEAAVAFARDACDGPPPPGLGTLLYHVAEAAEADAAVGPSFAGLPPTVVDFADETGDHPARLTVAHGRLRVFTGIRFDRQARSRPPDARIRISPPRLAVLLLGGGSAVPDVEGDDHGVVGALADAGRVLETRDEARSAIERASGPAR